MCERLHTTIELLYKLYMDIFIFFLLKIELKITNVFFSYSMRERLYTTIEFLYSCIYSYVFDKKNILVDLN